MTNHPNRNQTFQIGSKVQSIPDADLGTVKKIDRRDGKVLVSWANGQETWARKSNLRAV